jgi:WhiB family redox-sensing transcriptional regulator
MRVEEEQMWMRAAACRGRERAAVFYPPQHQESRAEKTLREQMAKAICETCDVRAFCLEHALETREPFGIWGGKTEFERRTMLGVASH